jgi:membrane protease YdiL (CAAX protease family)
VVPDSAPPTVPPNPRHHPLVISIVFALSAYFLVPELLSHAVSGLEGRFANNRWVVWVLNSAFAWALFFLTYAGIRLSGFRLFEVIDGHWQLRQPVKYYVKATFVLGVLVLAVDISLAFAGAFSRSSRPLPGTIVEFLLAIFRMASAGFIEEVIFRGFLLGEFTSITNRPVLATYLRAVLFACAHGWDQTAIGWVDKFLSGLLFAWSLKKTKSLIPAILVHSGLNTLAILLVGILKWSQQ